MTRRSTRPRERLATAADYAAADFKPDPRPLAALPSGSDWLARARLHYPLVTMAMHVIADDPAGVTRAAAAEPEAMLRFADDCHTVSGYYGALSELLKAASLRAMVGLSRHAAAEVKEEGAH